MSTLFKFVKAPYITVPEYVAAAIATSKEMTLDESDRAMRELIKLHGVEILNYIHKLPVIRYPR